MADISDVLNALVTEIAGILYPTPPSGEDASPVVGVAVRVEAGWPLPQALDVAMGAGKSHVSVFPPAGSERNTTRYSEDWQEVSRNAHIYTVTIAGQTITIGGAAPATFYAHNFAVLLGTAAPYLYTSTAGQTPAAIAAALQALIAVDYPAASVLGAVITLPADADLKAARVGTGGRLVSPVGEVQRQVVVSIWSPSIANRDTIAKALDVPLRKVRFLTLADLTKCRLHHQASRLDDSDQKAGIFRRDFTYLVEYAVVDVLDATEIVGETRVIGTQTDGAASSDGAPVSTIYE
ncbi:MAG: hypothetical protein GC190_21885 [Alphaproteobacteria bacterium]|nr:hypothetical protein [Alphaproteobacteria bacterium]